MSIEAVRYILQQDIKPIGLKFYLERLAYAMDNETGIAWPSQKRLSKELSLSERSVRKYQEKAVKCGYIIVSERRRADGSKASNGYELPGFIDWLGKSDEFAEQIFQDAIGTRGAGGDRGGSQAEHGGPVPPEHGGPVPPEHGGPDIERHLKTLKDNLLYENVNTPSHDVRSGASGDADRPSGLKARQGQAEAFPVKLDEGERQFDLGEQKSEAKKKRKQSQGSAPPNYSDRFLRLWSVYRSLCAKRKVPAGVKKTAYRSWVKLKAAEKDAAEKGLRGFVAAYDQAGYNLKHLSSYLNQQAWEGQDEEVLPEDEAFRQMEGAPLWWQKPDIKTIALPDEFFNKLLERHFVNGNWDEKELGPKPGQENSAFPAHFAEVVEKMQQEQENA